MGRQGLVSPSPSLLVRSPKPLPSLPLPQYPPPPGVSPLLFSGDSGKQAMSGTASNQAPGLLGPVPASFPPGIRGAHQQQSPAPVSQFSRALGSLAMAGSCPHRPPLPNQPGGGVPANYGSLPYPPREYGSSPEEDSIWLAPYPSLSGRYIHVHPRPYIYNAAGGGSHPPPPLVEQTLYDLPPANANVFSHPVPQIQLPLTTAAADKGGPALLEQRGEELEHAGTQQGAQQIGPGNEGGAEAVRMEAHGAADDPVGIWWLAEASLAPATRKCYQGAWERWLCYQAYINGGTSGQIPSITGFMWKLYNEGVSKARVGSLLAGISFMTRLNGTQDPTKSFIIAKALKGWSRIQPLKNDTRRPIDGQMLARLVEVLRNLTMDEYEALLFGLAFSVAYHGAFRISELVARSKIDIGGALLSRNVVLQPKVIRCKIVRSKTDQLGRGHWLAIKEQQGTSICPVMLANKFASLRPPGEGPWLIHMDNTPLTKFQFNALLKRALGEIGLNPGDYCTHSFRIGAATAAAVRGASITEIQALGRWKSQSYRKYIRPNK
ncbi:uncharacterized protein LOC142160342 [Mixophyes fleayi]|uniref:uncharacterized protein LOC142160342 n=1 Tax=Mixophyes fleayi TaxID=3061075 RepID=UPI003F4E21C3